MRGVSRWAPRIAPLIAVFLVLGATAAWADDPPTLPTDPPQARLSPPGGIAAPDTEARMNPPAGGTARLGPPGGAPTPNQMSLVVKFLLWLQSL